MSTETVMPSNHIILCCPLILLPSIFPSIRVFSNELGLHIRWPKYWSFSFHICTSNEYSGLISSRICWSLCCPRDSQESSPKPQLENVSSLALSLLYGPTLTSIHDYWKKNNYHYIYLYQQSDLTLYIHSFSDSFPYRLLENIKYSSLCYIVGPCWLSILYIVVCVY